MRKFILSQDKKSRIRAICRVGWFMDLNCQVQAYFSLSLLPSPYIGLTLWARSDGGSNFRYHSQTAKSRVRLSLCVALSSKVRTISLNICCRFSITLQCSEFCLFLNQFLEKANVIILRSIRSTPGAKGGISCPKGHASKGRGWIPGKTGVLLRRENGCRVGTQ